MTTANKFNGKTFLVLGSNTMATDIVKYARENGAYVIVADYYPKEKSPAKCIANEAVDISTLDVPALIDFGEKRHIDGVFAGISEKNLLSAMRVSEKLGLRFYFNQDQWDRVNKKDEFRKLCIGHGVPCPETYFIGQKKDISDAFVSHLPYPVIVKPVDCAASLGVSICTNTQDCKAAIELASSVSESGRIIIEEMVQGNEFTAHYTICNGKTALTCMDNRYPVSVNSGNVTTIPVARIYPSTYLDEYMELVNQPMLSLCESLGLNNAVVFIQGLYDEKQNKFHIFEAGLRSAAELPCRFLEKITGQNYIYMLVDYILTGETDYDLAKESPDLNGKCAGIISFVTKGGVVGLIEGLVEAVNNTPSVLFYESRYPVGTETPGGNTLRQLMIRFGMICSNRSEMAKDVQYLNDHITVLDDKGSDMVIKMNPERITKEFLPHSK